MHSVWGTPDLSKVQTRLVAVVTTLRADIDTGDSRTCQAAIEDLSETFLELDESDVPANYIAACAPSRPGCASPSASITCNASSSSPRRTR
jgi:hypothetical protein